MHRKDVKSMKRKNAGNSLVPVGIGIVVIMVIILIVSIVMKQKGGGSGGGKTLDQLYDKVKVTEATPKKGQVTFESNKP